MVRTNHTPFGVLGCLCLAAASTMGAVAAPPTIPDTTTPRTNSSNHWAFVPPQRPPIPDLRQPGRARTAIDRFVEAALQSRGLSLSVEADPATLLRRVSFDLTGLPPTPSEIAAFLEGSSLNAYERMVEHYLASPHYGERWGKFWLDASGYADSNGYFNADSDRLVDRIRAKFADKHIAYGDIVRNQPVETVARQISYLADAVVEAALDFARRHLEPQYGHPLRADGEVLRQLPKTRFRLTRPRVLTIGQFGGR